MSRSSRRGQPQRPRTVSYLFFTGPVCVSYSTATARQSLFTPSHSKFLLTLNPSRVSCVCGQFFLPLQRNRFLLSMIDPSLLHRRHRSITSVSTVSKSMTDRVSASRQYRAHDGPCTSLSSSSITRVYFSSDNINEEHGEYSRR
jgi:hypothetical protein